MNKINVKQKLSLFDEFWTQKLIALNKIQVLSGYYTYPPSASAFYSDLAALTRFLTGIGGIDKSAATVGR